MAIAQPLVNRVAIGVNRHSGTSLLVLRTLVPDTQFDRVIAQEVADFRRHARRLVLVTLLFATMMESGCHRRR